MKGLIVAAFVAGALAVAGPALRRLACARIAATGGRHPFMFVARSFRTHSSR